MTADSMRSLAEQSRNREKGFKYSLEEIQFFMHYHAFAGADGCTFNKEDVRAGDLIRLRGAGFVVESVGDEFRVSW